MLSILVSHFVALFPGLAGYLGWPAILDDPGCRSPVEGAGRPVQLDIHVSFDVGILGDALVDIELGLVHGIDLIDKTINPVALGSNDIGISSLIDLPTVVDQPGPPNVPAVWTSSLHLGQVKIAAVGKVVCGWPVSRLLSDCLGGHDEQEPEE